MKLLTQYEEKCMRQFFLSRNLMIRLFHLLSLLASFMALTVARAEQPQVTIISKPELVKSEDILTLEPSALGVRITISGEQGKDYKLSDRSYLEKFEDDQGTNLINPRKTTSIGLWLPPGTGQFGLDLAKLGNRPRLHYDSSTGMLAMPAASAGTGIIVSSKFSTAPEAHKIYLKGVIVLDQLGNPQTVRIPTPGEAVQLGTVRLKFIEVSEVSDDQPSELSWARVPAETAQNNLNGQNRELPDPKVLGARSITIVEDTIADEYKQISYWTSPLFSTDSQKPLYAQPLLNLPPNESGDTLYKIKFDRPTFNFVVRIRSRDLEQIKVPFDLELDLP